MRVLEPSSLTQHVDRLYRAALALCGNREDAEDLMQETFARVLAGRRLLRNDRDLSYLMVALRTTFRSGRRNAARRPTAAATLKEGVVEDTSPVGRPDWALEINELYATIAELPDHYRLAIVTVDVLGLSYRQASRMLRVPEVTVATRLHRARRYVASRLLPSQVPAERPSTQEASLMSVSPMS